MMTRRRGGTPERVEKGEGVRKVREVGRQRPQLAPIGWGVVGLSNDSRCGAEQIRKRTRGEVRRGRKEKERKIFSPEAHLGSDRGLSVMAGWAGTVDFPKKGNGSGQGDSLKSTAVLDTEKGGGRRMVKGGRALKQLWGMHQQEEMGLQCAWQRLEVGNSGRALYRHKGVGGRMSRHVARFVYGRCKRL